MILWNAFYGIFKIKKRLGDHITKAIHPTFWCCILFKKVDEYLVEKILRLVKINWWLCVKNKIGVKGPENLVTSFVNGSPQNSFNFDLLIEYNRWFFIAVRNSRSFKSHIIYQFNQVVESDLKSLLRAASCQKIVFLLLLKRELAH